MTLSEKTIGAIARALLSDRKALSKNLAFWSAPGPRQRMAGQHVKALNRDLQENASALVEMAERFAPWLKQRADWQTIVNNEPTMIKEGNA